YDTKKLSVWEDIYGRSLVGSVLSYILMMVKDTSPFDIPGHIRNRLFIMETCFITAFGLVMIGFKDLSILSATAIILTFNVFSDKFIGLNMVFIIAAIGGMVIIANPFDLLVTNVNQMIPVISMGGALLLLSLGRQLCGHIKQ